MSDYNYTIPSGTRIGHVHLKVSDIERSLEFYCGLLGFELQMRYGSDAVFISAGAYHHHIGLNTWQSKNAPPAPPQYPGLFHTAIVYPSRKELAMVLDRLIKNEYPLSGAADHGVSEAIYLDDPDKNGVELYWDKPESDWPRNADGSLAMFTDPLNIQDLLKEIG